MLAAALPQDQKQITDNNESLHLLESLEALHAKVDVAVAMYKDYLAKGATKITVIHSVNV